MKIKTLLFAGVTAFLLTNCTSNKFIVCGHRGAMGHETENTLAAINKGIELHADMLEIDVFKIKTGELVVFHDDDLGRLTDANGKIEDYSFDALRKVVVAGHHQIPTLQEVIETIDRKAVLNIELKGNNTATDTYLIIEAFKKKGWQNKDFFISSFKVAELKMMRSLNKKVAIGYLTYKDSLPAIIKVAKEMNAQAINPYYKTVTAENIAIMKANNFKIYPWTVNDLDAIQNLKALKVNGIITDYPERITR